MTSIQQLLRLASVPLAMSIFLLVAQSAGGFAMRDTPEIHVALR
jgi:hypothetical protein